MIGTGAPVSGASITLLEGQSAVCTIINNDIAQRKENSYWQSFSDVNESSVATTSAPSLSGLPGFGIGSGGSPLGSEAGVIRPSAIICSILVGPL